MEYLYFEDKHRPNVFYTIIERTLAYHCYYDGGSFPSALADIMNRVIDGDLVRITKEQVSSRMVSPAAMLELSEIDILRAKVAYYMNICNSLRGLMQTAIFDKVLANP